MGEVICKVKYQEVVPLRRSAEQVRVAMVSRAVGRHNREVHCLHFALKYLGKKNFDSLKGDLGAI